MSTNPFSNPTSLNFDLADIMVDTPENIPPIEGKKEKVNPDPTPDTPPTPTPNSTPEGKEKEGADDKKNISLNKPANFTLEDLMDPNDLDPDETKDKKGEGEGGEDPDDVNLEQQTLIDTLNDVAELFGGELEPYEGYTEEDPINKENFLKMIQHNLEIEREKAIESFFNDLPPMVQEITQYALNAEGDEEQLVEFAKVLLDRNDITSLNPENSDDQEKIVKKYYESQKWTSEEILEKIGDLKDSNSLAKEAKRLKPKLDDLAQQIAQEKQDAQKQMKAIQLEAQKGFLSRVTETFKGDKLGNISLTPKEKQEIVNYLVSDNVELTLPGKNKTTMSYLEALIAYHKYSPKADIENLALAAWILSDREGFDKKYGKMIETKISSEFVKDHKYDTKIKSGQLKIKTSGQNTTPQSGGKGWGDVFKK